MVVQVSRRIFDVPGERPSGGDVETPLTVEAGPDVEKASQQPAMAREDGQTASLMKLAAFSSLMGCLR